MGAKVGNEFSDYFIKMSPILTEKKAPENESLLSYGEYLSVWIAKRYSIRFENQKMRCLKPLRFIFNNGI